MRTRGSRRGPRSRSPGFRTRSLRTCQGLRPRGVGCAIAILRATRVAFRQSESVGTPFELFAAQWLAYAYPDRRFVSGLTTGNARLGADVARDTFIVEDFHHLLLAGLPALRLSRPMFVSAVVVDPITYERITSEPGRSRVWPNRLGGIGPRREGDEL